MSICCILTWFLFWFSDTPFTDLFHVICRSPYTLLIPGKTFEVKELNYTPKSRNKHDRELCLTIYIFGFIYIIDHVTWGNCHCHGPYRQRKVHFSCFPFWFLSLNIATFSFLSPLMAKIFLFIMILFYLSFNMLQSFTNHDCAAFYTLLTSLCYTYLVILQFNVFERCLMNNADTYLKLEGLFRWNRWAAAWLKELKISGDVFKSISLLEHPFKKVK